MVSPSRIVHQGSGIPSHASPKGTLFQDIDAKAGFYINIAGTADWYSAKSAAGNFIEDFYLFPRPHVLRDSDWTYTADTTFVGGTYEIPRRMKGANRLICRCSTYVAPATMAIGVYQLAGGRTGSNLTRIISLTGQTVTASTTHVYTISATDLDRGLLVILWGKDSGTGNFSMYGYDAEPHDLLNQNLPSGIGEFPINFTTAINCAAGPPATFDPRPVPTGSATPNTDDALTLIVGFARV